MKDKHRGAHAELKAAAWLLEQGFDVFRNVSPHGDTDLVAIKDGVVRRFDVKATQQGGSPIEGVEYLAMLPDGSFRIFEKRRPHPPKMREMTPREIVLQKLGASFD